MRNWRANRSSESAKFTAYGRQLRQASRKIEQGSLLLPLVFALSWSTKSLMELGKDVSLALGRERE